MHCLTQYHDNLCLIATDFQWIWRWLVLQEKKKKVLLSLVPRPSHVFQCTREKSTRPGGFRDVMMTLSAIISAMHVCGCRNGGRYVIITSPNWPDLPSFSRACWKTWEDLGTRVSFALTQVGRKQNIYNQSLNKVKEGCTVGGTHCSGCSPPSSLAPAIILDKMGSTAYYCSDRGRFM